MFLLSKLVSVIFFFSNQEHTHMHTPMISSKKDNVKNYLYCYDEQNISSQDSNPIQLAQSQSF